MTVEDAIARSLISFGFDASQAKQIITEAKASPLLGSVRWYEDESTYNPLAEISLSGAVKQFAHEWAKKNVPDSWLVDAINWG